MEKISLNGKWLFKATDDNDFLEATVPGTNFSDLYNLGKIPDPFVLDNEKTVAWVSEKDWIYQKNFSLSENTLLNQYLEICFDMLDTITKVYLNGKELAFTNNIHRTHVFDIKPYAVIGENTLTIIFYSPIKYIEAARKYDDKPANTNGIKGSPLIRKTQCHFGWDWGPYIPTVGLGRSVYILAYNIAKITEIFPVQTHNSDGSVSLDVQIKLSSDSYQETEITLSTPDGKTETVLAKAGKALFLINSPLLWNTNDISDKKIQPLYTVNAKILSERNSSVSVRIGLRTIVLERNKDAYGKQFRFVVNGIPVFAKGANEIPFDSLYNRFDNNKLDYFFDAICDANINMLRVWGGGFYESDAFYDKCDELGILVWQDFTFACAQYPFYNGAFLSTVLQEIKDNATRLRHHASLAIWCGNNEIEMLTPTWFWKRKLIKWTKKFFHEILPTTLATIDNVTPYITGSPSSSDFLKNVNSHNDGDTHLWNVWHGLQPLTYYRKRFSRFCSEFGMESLPDIQTINYFARPQDMAIDSSVFSAHQKCLSGNDKIQYYVATHFHIPQKIKDLAYLSQITQAECIRDATEHWRRNKGRCNGAIYWQLNDCWPTLSWSSIDYFGRYKALHYAAKHFNAPVTTSIYTENGKNAILYILNDKPYDISLTLENTLETFDGKKLFSDTVSVTVTAGKAEKIKVYDFSKEISQTDGNVVFYTKAKDNTYGIQIKTLLFKPEKKLLLPQPTLTVENKIIDNKIFVTITSAKYARYVFLSLDNSTKPFSDNFFDMLAGETKTVSVPLPTNFDIARNKITVRALGEYKTKFSPIKEFLFCKKILFKPENFAMWIYYHFI